MSHDIKQKPSQFHCMVSKVVQPMCPGYFQVIIPFDIPEEKSVIINM